MKVQKLLILFLFLGAPFIVYGSCGHCGGDNPGAKEVKSECGDKSCEKCSDNNVGVKEGKSDCKDGSCSVESKDAAVKTEKNSGDRFVGVSDPSINVPALEALLNTKIPLKICDARSGKYDDGKRIPGALTLNDKSSPEAVKTALPDKDKLVVTYCVNLKCGASHNLFLHLKKLGYKNVVELPEGIEGWVKAGHRVEKIN